MAREIEGAAGFDLRDPSIYRHWSRVTIRFSDEDRMGHVNNAVYSVWLEACRVEYLYQLFDPSAELDTVLTPCRVGPEATRFPDGGAMLRGAAGLPADAPLATCRPSVSPGREPCAEPCAEPSRIAMESAPQSV